MKKYCMVALFLLAFAVGTNEGTATEEQHRHRHKHHSGAHHHQHSHTHRKHHKNSSQVAEQHTTENKTNKTVVVAATVKPVAENKVVAAKRITVAPAMVQEKVAMVGTAAAAAQTVQTDVQTDVQAASDGDEKELDGSSEDSQVQDSGIDIDTQMPYGELEPFGREDTAQELTEQSVSDSNDMVDQLERAEVAEEKRATFRALTRLRGAAITSFDGIARSQTGNIDEYNKVHKWRDTHPLAHLASEESDISKWAFPNDADF